MGEVWSIMRGNVVYREVGGSVVYHEGKCGL